MNNMKFSGLHIELSSMLTKHHWDRFQGLVSRRAPKYRQQNNSRNYANIQNNSSGVCIYYD